MTFTRLGSVAPDIANDIAPLDESRSRIVNLALVEWALRDANLDDARLAAALVDLRRGERPTAVTRDGIRRLIDELDEKAWDIQEESAEPDSEEGYVRAFRDARAVNAVLYALDDPSSEATTECAYEAQAARGDLDGLRRLIRSAMVGTW